MKLVGEELQAYSFGGDIWAIGKILRKKFWCIEITEVLKKDQIEKGAELKMMSMSNE